MISFSSILTKAVANPGSVICRGESTALKIMPTSGNFLTTESAKAFSIASGPNSPKDKSGIPGIDTLALMAPAGRCDGSRCTRRYVRDAGRDIVPARVSLRTRIRPRGWKPPPRCRCCFRHSATCRCARTSKRAQNFPYRQACSRPDKTETAALDQ